MVPEQEENVVAKAGTTSHAAYELAGMISFAISGFSGFHAHKVIAWMFLVVGVVITLIEFRKREYWKGLRLLVIGGLLALFVWMHGKKAEDDALAEAAREKKAEERDAEIKSSVDLLGADFRSFVEFERSKQARQSIGEASDNRKGLTVERATKHLVIDPMSREEQGYSSLGGNCYFSPILYSTASNSRGPSYLFFEYGIEQPVARMKIEGKLVEFKLIEEARSRPKYESRQKGDKVLYNIQHPALQGQLVSIYNGLSPECAGQGMCESYSFSVTFQITMNGRQLPLDLFGECGL